MSQQEVLKFLRSKPKEWFNYNDIVKNCNVSKGVANKGIKKLTFFKDIETKILIVKYNFGSYQLTHIRFIGEN